MTDAASFSGMRSSRKARRPWRREGFLAEPIIHFLRPLEVLPLPPELVPFCVDPGFDPPLPPRIFGPGPLVVPMPFVPTGGLLGNATITDETAMADQPYECFAEADEGTLQEILREAESYLNAQLTAAIAADQRAIAFASLLGAAAVVIAGGGGALLLSERPNPALGWTCMAIVGTFLVAMAFANLAAMPSKFWFAGNSPAGWLEDVRAQRPLRASLAEQLVHYADMIADNDKLMRRNGTQMKVAVWIAWSGLAIGGMAAIILFAWNDGIGRWLGLASGF
jgi:hypothetical protein